MKWALAGLAVCGLLLLAGTVRAQNGLPEPPAELKQLQFLVGKFRFTAHPPPQVSADPVEFRSEGSWISNGWQLLRRETSTAADGTLETTQIISYDAPSKHFRFWWFSPGEITTEPGWEGHFEGRKLVFEAELPLVAAGFSVSPEGGLLRVHTVFPGSAAERLGLKEGDVIARIDDLAASPCRLSGKPGTTVRLVALHDGRERRLTLKRERGVQRLIWEPLGPGSYRFIHLMGLAGSLTQISSVDWLSDR